MTGTLTAAQTQRLIQVARGDAPADLVIAGAHVFSVFTREWLDVDVAVCGDRVAGLGSYPDAVTRIDATGQWLVPGYIDSHVHIESSKLPVHEFARLVLEHGTTTIVADPHEIANVLGARGVHWLLDACSKVPLEVFIMAPSCVPASHFESAGATITREDMESILRRRYALGIGEMMNFPGVIAGAGSEIDKLAAAGSTHADGHAPGVTGSALDAYIAAGIRTDHESTSVDEALEKRRRGMWVLLREASNAHNLRALLPLVQQFGPDMCAFCTDDRDPDLLRDEGHIDQMCRLAAASGLAPEDILVLTTINPARAHGLTEHGAIAPGRRADLQLLPDLSTFRPSDVWVGGQHVVTDGRCVALEAPAVPDWVRDTVRIASISPSDLQIPWTSGSARLIVAHDEQLVTGSETVDPLVVGGFAVADPARDIAKMAVVERHRATGRIGLGLIRGFGLSEGAFASTVAHDAHNIVVVGAEDASMHACIVRLAELGGGIVVARAGAVTGELALPIAGLLADATADEVVETTAALTAQLRTMGVISSAPFMLLSFMALSVIPRLKLTDRGLVDVERFQVVPLEASLAPV